MRGETRGRALRTLDFIGDRGVPKNDLAARVGSSYLVVDGVEKFCYNTFEKFGE